MVDRRVIARCVQKEREPEFHPAIHRIAAAGLCTGGHQGKGATAEQEAKRHGAGEPA